MRVKRNEEMNSFGQDVFGFNHFGDMPWGICVRSNQPFDV